MSNLLKDASILLTPTGYDNGSMNAIKPENGDGDFQFSRNSAATRVNAQGLVENVQILSSNLVSNGDFSQEGVQEVSNGSFDTDTKWTTNTGWSISGGSANCDGTQSSNATLVQQNGIKGAIIDFVVGKTYKVNFDIVVTSGAITYIEVASGYDNNDITTSGNHTTYITAVSTNDRFTITGNPDFIGSIDNVSVKEVGQDWTLGTGWSIGEDKAISVNGGNYVTYQPALTSGKKYKISYEVKDYVSGSFSVRANAVSGALVSANGVYTDYLTSDGIQLYLMGGGNFNGSITNISVLEITDDTNLPRINYEGFSYQDSLGSEVSNDVNFDNPLNWSLTGQSTVSNGVAHILQDNTSNTGIAADTTIINKKYKITGVVSDYVSGSIGFASIGSASPREAIPSQNGEFTIYYTSTRSTPSAWNIQRISSPCNLKIDNVSVKEYLGQEVVPDSGCGSWLLEPQSTNLITYSEDFSNGSWVKSNTTINLNQTTSPSGDVTADVLVGNTTNGRHGLIRGLSSNTEKGSFTLFVKKKELRFIQIASANNTNQVINFDSQLGVFGNIGAGFTNVKVTPLTNDWFKISGSTVLNSYAGFYISLVSSNTASWLESWVMPNNTDGLYIWGAQLEQNFFPTSYIPTSGAASTRLKDIANNSGNASLINSEEGVLYAEIASLKGQFDSNRTISLSDSTNGNQIRFYFPSNIEGQIKIRVDVGGSTIYIFDYNITTSETPIKLAFRYSPNGMDLYSNGALVSSSLLFPNFTNNLNSLQFRRGDGQIGADFYGKNKALAVYKTALTDASLRSLTYPPAVATTFDLDFDTIAEQFTFTRGSEATFVNAQGLIQSTASNDAPRLDYSTGAEAFLLEPQSTNLVQYSEDFGQSYWRKLGNPTITDNQVESPNGDLTADLFEATENSSRIDLNNVLLSAITYTASIYVKSSGSGSNSFKFYAFGGTQNIFSATNEWVKYSFTVTPSYTTALVFEALNTNTSVYIWGAQLEQQSYATSYIPTSGASATRNQELCNNATPVINSEEGTLYAEIGSLIGDESVGQLSLSNGTANETVKILYLSSNSVRVEMQTVSGVNFVKDITLTRDGTFDKVAIRYKSNNYAVYHNGVSQTVTQTADTPIGLNKIAFNRGDGGSIFFGNTKGLKVYPKALADVQLEDLTTI